ncbi:MAG: hypothetical protein Q4F66_02050 [Clostridium sp.]|nr:hypothetical protein [Clostridium sp.]
MDSKIKKIYNKALDLHEKGEINKALDLCETALAENLGEAEILNFKGLMLYEKGLLKEAVTVWKINADLNNDSMAKSYIKDAEYDEVRAKTYKDAEQALKKSDINNAVKLFLECAKSDFNCIKVNTGIAWCYQKKGDYYRAKEYVDKALKIDRNAVTANEIKKQLEDMDLYYGERKNGKGIGMISIAVAVVIIISIGGYLFLKKYNGSEHITADNSEITNEQVNIDKQELETPYSEEDINTSDDEELNNFNHESLASAIDNRDYNSIYDNIHNIKTDRLITEEKKLYDKAVSILKREGASSFYEYGLGYFNEKDYDNAEDQLDKAYEYSQGNNLEQHIIFYRGSTASEQGNKDLTLQMYEKYDELYPSGSYTEGVLYELALLTAYNDEAKSKMYAQKLIDNHPESIYINDKITSILNKES